MREEGSRLWRRSLACNAIRKPARTLLYADDKVIILHKKKSEVKESKCENGHLNYDFPILAVRIRVCMYACTYAATE